MGQRSKSGSPAMPSHKGERIFISYSHRDKDYLESLKEILTPSIRDRHIIAWDDTTIKPSLKWRDEIDKALSSATIALLLVSDHYLASDFIAKNEFLPILDRVERGGLRVFWMLLNPCLWDKTKIAEYQAIHDTNEPLRQLTPDKRQGELVRICEYITEMARPPSIIKGWYPYTYKDKDIFADLQRGSFVEKCVSGICQEAFRFGLLYGESGVGKTSVLQAGLWPRLEAEGHDCGYVVFSNEPPLDSIRRFFRESNFLSETEIRDGSFVSLLQKLAQQRSKPLVLLLDQFEQVLVQPNYGPEDEFFQALTSWYCDTPIPLIKLLVSVEGNFSREMWPLLTAMKYQMHPQQCFRLSKLKRDEAAVVVRIMAEREGLPFEPGFVDRLTEESSSKKEEKVVSPVDLQIMAHTIQQSESDEGRAFTTRAFNRMGGIEGTYGRVLEEELEKHDPESQDIARQVLKSLIDWNKGTRANALTREELMLNIDAGQTYGKRQRTVEMRNLLGQKLDHTLRWLCSCRFITRGKRLGVDVYELAHDRLTRAVIRLLAGDIEQVHKANRLLTQRCNEWKGNDQDSRFLLSRRELRLIKRYRLYLEWDAEKDGLFQGSIERVRRKMAGMMTVIVVCVLALVLLIGAWNEKILFPLKYAQEELPKVSQHIRNPETLSEIAKALFFVKDFEHVSAVINQMEEDWDKDVARSEIARSALSNDRSFLKEANALADDIQDKTERFVTKCMLKEIVHEKDDACEYPRNSRHSTQPGELIKTAHEYAMKEIDPVEKLDIIAALVQAETFNSPLPHENGQTLLSAVQQQVEALHNRPEEHFRNFQGMRSAAEIAAYLGDANEASKILADAKHAAEKILRQHERSQAMRSIAIAASQFALIRGRDCQKPTCDLKQVNKWFELAEEAKGEITEDSDMYAALSSIVEANVGLASIYESTELLEKAHDMAKKIHGKAHRSSSLRLLVTEMVKSNETRQAVDIAEQNETDVKGDLLANILLAAKGYSMKDKKYLSLRLPKIPRAENMIEIPAGHFTMGSMEGDLNEKPEHTVYVDGFLLDSSETTVKMYDEFLKQTRRQRKPGYWNWKNEIPLDDREKPVIGVTWREAKSYCRWRQKRLPTEAEWEKAARGIGKRKYPWGSSHNGKYPANYDKKDPKGDPYSVLTKVGSFKNEGGDSPYAIHDMAGNAWEWVEDWYDGSAYVGIHTSGYPASSIGDYKILRGGSWDNTVGDDRLRSTFRLPRDPKDSYETYGFRCAQSVDTLFNAASQFLPQK
jgi:formylglycine-generating enzyme required for sulfatase activity